MKQLLHVSLFLLFLSQIIFAKEEFGTLTFILLKDGSAIKHAEVNIDRKTNLFTDEDGYISRRLNTGKHQLEVFGKESGILITYAKKNFNIIANSNTQIIMSLDKNNTLVLDDVEMPKGTQSSINKKDLSTMAKGTLALKVFESESKKPIKDARVFVRGLPIQGKTDENGTIRLQLPQGVQTISIIHGQFSSKTLTDIKIASKKTTLKNVQMTPASLELEEFVVLVPNISGSIASVISKQRNSDVVGDIMGSEQFSKSGDSDVASALKRASGLTIVGGKYVYVRGLGDRYSTILFNDLYVPSPNPTKRVVPLDIFPTSVVKNISIQKAYTADLPGSFAGGAIMINSLDIPKNDGFLKAEVELKANSATGKNVLGNSDNSNGLPSSVISASDNFQEIYFDKNIDKDVINYRSYNKKSSQLPPGYKLSLSGGKSFDTNMGFKVGITGSVFYQNEADQKDVFYDKYIYNNFTDKHQLEEKTNRSVSLYETKYGGLISLGAESDDGNNRLKYTFFNMNQFNDTTTSGMTTFIGDANPYDLTYYEYLEQKIMLHQLNGKHNIIFAKDTDGYFDNIVIKWAAEKGEATRKEPGTVEYQYDYIYTAPTLNKKTWYLYGDLKDDISNYRVDMSLPFVFNERDNSTDFGLFVYNKKRTLDNRRFKMQHSFANSDSKLEEDIDSIFTDENIDELSFSTNYRPADSYEAKQDLKAFYLKQLISVTNSLDFVASVRYEDSKQELIDAKSSQAYDPLKTTDYLPGVGMTYRLNDDMQFRLAYSNTITRPDFREFSPNRFKDPITGDIIFGYPGLKQTDITNYDIKYEWYMSADELFSFALFKKDFINPIETIQSLDVQSDASNQIVSFRNADGANSYGFEMDLRKRFAFIDERLESLLLATNFAYIQSQVQITRNKDDEMTAHLTTTDRPMMGQSPYVLNIALGYDSKETGNSVLLLYNEIGERLVALGTYGNADKYEQPFRKMDIVAKWKLNNTYKENSIFTYAMKFKAENLLDSEVKITQAGNDTFHYKPGQKYTLSFSIKY